jgi:hypothetical protein
VPQGTMQRAAMPENSVDAWSLAMCGRMCCLTSPSSPHNHITRHHSWILDVPHACVPLSWMSTWAAREPPQPPSIRSGRHVRTKQDTHLCSELRSCFPPRQANAGGRFDGADLALLKAGWRMEMALARAFNTTPEQSPQGASAVLGVRRVSSRCDWLAVTNGRRKRKYGGASCCDLRRQRIRAQARSDAPGRHFL